MRYELYLTRLPKLEPSEIKAKLGDLPAGLSTGTLKQALETKKVPTLAIAWSEDKQATLKIRARLNDLGAAVRFEDHASAPIKVLSSVGETLGGLLASVMALLPKPSMRTKSATKKKRTTHPVVARLGAIFGPLLIFVMKLAVAIGLYSAQHLGSATAEESSIEWLAPRFVALTIGLFSVHLMTVSVTAVLAQRIKIFMAAPMLVGSFATLVFAFINLDAPEFQKTIAVEEAQPSIETVAKLPPPPSHPYQGLVEELRIRQMKDSERVLQEVRDTASDEERAQLGLGKAKQPNTPEPEQKPAATKALVTTISASTPSVPASPDVRVAATDTLAGARPKPTTTPGSGKRLVPMQVVLAMMAGPALEISTLLEIESPTPRAAPPAPAAPPPTASLPPIAAATAPEPRAPAKAAPPPTPLSLVQQILADIDPLQALSTTAALWLISFPLAFLLYRRRERKRFEREAEDLKRVHEDGIVIVKEQAQVIQRQQTKRLKRELEDELKAAKAQFEVEHAQELERLRKQLAEARAAQERSEAEAATLRRLQEDRRSGEARSVKFAEAPTQAAQDQTVVAPPQAVTLSRPKRQPEAPKVAAVPRSSYAVFNVEEERIAVPERNKR